MKPVQRPGLRDRAPRGARLGGLADVAVGRLVGRGDVTADAHSLEEADRGQQWGPAAEQGSALARRLAGEGDAHRVRLECGDVLVAAHPAAAKRRSWL
ncbi:hypothetical protein ACFWWB_26385 [Streptomyces sp. NPDC058690]|uniref:hypothetical protein n=1 Tax=Streptomyces sp. NPDC058690 TaxID=3346600 RepID=UPI00365117CB